MKFIILLRGHIRKTFENNKLLDFFLKLKKLYYIDIYIHTWDVYSSKVSWREIEENLNIVTKELLYNYFNEIRQDIKHIIIDNDSNLPLIGSVDGNVGGAPKRGWKNMWYGQYNMINYMKENITDYDNELIINMRFDLFDSYFSYEESLYIKKLHELYIDNHCRNEDLNINDIRTKMNELSGNIKFANELITDLNSKVDFMNDIKNVDFEYLENFQNDNNTIYNIIEKLTDSLISMSKIYDRVNSKQKILLNKNPLGKSLRGIIFLDDSNLVGIDNFYISNLNGMHKIITNFHNNLDEIVVRYSNIKYQESLLYYENFIV